MQRRDGFDLSTIRAVAAKALGTADLSVQRTEGGVAGQVYRVVRGGDEFFLRLGDDPVDNLSVDADVHTRLAELGVRVPAVVHVDPLAELVDRSVLITRHIGGVPLIASTDHAGASDVARAAGRDLALINTVAVHGFGWVRRDQPGTEAPWPPFGAYRDYASFVVDDLPDPWPGAFGDLFTVDELGRIEAIVDDERNRPIVDASLAHGDFALDHVFHDDGRYTGIIDFGEIRGTEPYFDLGVYLQSGVHLHPELRDAALDGYFEVTDKPADAMRPIHTAGFMKALRHLGYWLQPSFTLERPVERFARTIAELLLPAAERARTT